MKNTLLIFLSILFVTSVVGQDTISIYFDFGQSKIPSNQLSKFKRLAIDYDLSAVDSIHYIGMADSVGNIQKNIRLSEKRAKQVYKSTKSLIPQAIPVQFFALGENLASKDLKKNRRVDIVLFSVDQTDIDTLLTSIPLSESDPKCYVIDYDVLEKTFVKPITKRKKKYTVLELHPFDLRYKNKHHYLTWDKDGNKLIKRVKWKSRRTGKLWWMKQRLIATIPQKSFEAFKIFLIENPPCDSCNTGLSDSTTKDLETMCLQTDKFLIRNLQIKRSLFKRKSMGIRVPKEYVDPNSNYYVGCDHKQKITWKTKKGRRKQNYFYTELPVKRYCLSNITREYPCCKYRSKTSDCGSPFLKLGITCPPFLGPKLQTEIGNITHQGFNFTHATIGIVNEYEKDRSAIFIGLDNEMSLIGSVRYKYHFANIPYAMLNPFKPWNSPSALFEYAKYARLYWSGEIHNKLFNTDQEMIEPSLNLGIVAANYTEKSIYERIFVQGGIAYNVLDSKGSIYPTLKIGLNTNLHRFMK